MENSIKRTLQIPINELGQRKEKRQNKMAQGIQEWT